jgi:very-short-patch-repair endonuclease
MFYRPRYSRRSPQWKFDKAKEMRSNPTQAEAKMYDILYRNVVPKFPEHIFYRQSLKFGYILDFYCPTLQLGIEVDGSMHEGREWYDGNRDAVLAQRNIQVYHFSNYDVLNYPQEVASQLCQIIQGETSKRAEHACFIATAAYGTTTAKELDILRKFRDVKLEPNVVGRRITDLYYLVSPPIANIIARSKEMRAVVRGCLNPIINYLKRKKY